MTIRQGDRVRVIDRDALRHGMVGEVRRVLRANRDYRPRAEVIFASSNGTFPPYVRVIALDLLEPIQ